MFELLVAEKVLRGGSGPLVTIAPSSGIIRFNAKACSLHKFQQNKFARVYHDKVSNEIAIEMVNKDDQTGALTIMKGKVATATASLKAKSIVDKLKIESTLQFPFEMRVVKVRRSEAFGDCDEKEMCVISLAAGAPPRLTGRAATLKG